MSTDQNGRQIVATLDDLENLAANLPQGGLPSGGDVGDVVTNTAPGVGAWAAPTGGAGVILTATVDLTAGQIATLNSDPPQIIATPGANKAIVPVSAALQTVAGLVPFTNGEVGTLTLSYNPGTDAMSMGVADFNDSLICFGIPWTGGGNAIENLPLLLQADIDPEDPGGVDGTARLTVLYWVMDLAS